MRGNGKLYKNRKQNKQLIMSGMFEPSTPCGQVLGRINARDDKRQANLSSGLVQRIRQCIYQIHNTLNNQSIVRVY